MGTYTGYDSYTQAMVPTQEKRGGKALEICALIFGILSLCGCCYGLFGITGLVLSIVAITTGKKSGLSIAGLILSILGICTAVLWILFWLSPAGREMGQEFLKGFQKGFEQGYYGTYNGGEIDDTDKETNTVDEPEENGNSYKNPSLDAEVVGTVVINGKDITIPCKFSEIKDEFEYSELFNGDVLNSGLEAYDSELIYLSSDGKETGVKLSVGNYKDAALEDIKDGDVVEVAANYYTDSNVEVKYFKDISLNMSREDLENALYNINYDKEENDSYDYYRFTAGKNNEIHFAIFVEDGKIDQIIVDYLGE